MDQRRLVYALARVWREEDAGAPQIVGTALLVSSRYLLSCAHVVNAALGRAPDAASVPDAPVRLEFPASAPGTLFSARVVVWHPRVPRAGGRYDVAGLELGAPLPEGALPTPLILEASPDEPCRIFGFPAGRPGGNYADGVVGDVLANGWVMLRGGDEAREFVRPGYSGGPVYTARGVVGMVSEGERDARVREAVMIPAPALLAAWPELARFGSCPYRGLSSFAEPHAGVFFGREGETAALTSAVTRPASLTLLAGASGSGKSSLIAAGLLPRLRAEGWRAAHLQPGSAPFNALARAILPLWKPELTDVALLAAQTALARQLGDGTLSLADLMAELLADTDTDTDADATAVNTLLVIDQAEELLTHGGDAERFFGQVLSAHQHPEVAGRMGLLIGVRTDFLDRFAAPLARPDHRLLYLGPVGDLRAVIERPLEGGLSRLEPGLSERLVRDVRAEANPLPLLEFTLRALWHAQDQGRLTHAAYDALGGVSQAIARHAQATFETLSATEQAQAERLFVQLMQPTEGGPITRRVARFAELGRGAQPLLKKLADRHLIVTGRDPDRPDSAEVVHEALFEHWPRLRAWTEAHARFRRWQEGVRRARRDWLEAGRDPDYLLQGARLAVAEGYLSIDAEWLSPEEAGFIRLGLEREARQARAETAALQARARRRERLNRALTGFLVVAVALSGLAGWQWRRAEGQTQVAEALNTRLETTNRTLSEASQRVRLGARRALAHKLSAQGLLATRSPSPLSGDPRLGALLVAEATALDDNAQSRGNLLRALQSELVLHSDGEPLSALGPGGHTLALAHDGALSLWDTARKVRTRELAPPGTVYLSSLSFRPDGRVLAGTALDGSVRLWDVKNGLELAAPAAATDYPAMVAVFGPAGRLLIGTLDAQVQLWAQYKGEREGGWRRVGALSRSARRTAAEASPTLPLRRPSILTPEDEHLTWLRGVAFDPAGRALALLDAAGGVQLFRLTGRAPAEGAPDARFTLPDAARSLAFSPDGEALAVGDREGRVFLLDLRGGAPARSARTPLFALGSAVDQLAFSPDGQVLAAAEVAGAVVLWPLRAAAPAPTALPVKVERVHQLGFSGSRLLIRAREGPRTALYEVEIRGGVPVVRRNLRVTWQRDAGAALWDATGSNALSTPLLGGADTFAQGLSFSPDGRRLALRSDSRAVYLFDARSRKLVAGPLPGQEDLESAAFSPDAKVLATGTRGGVPSATRARAAFRRGCRVMAAPWRSPFIRTARPSRSGPKGASR